MRQIIFVNEEVARPNQLRPNVNTPSRDDVKLKKYASGETTGSNRLPPYEQYKQERERQKKEQEEAMKHNEMLRQRQNMHQERIEKARAVPRSSQGMINPGATSKPGI